MTWPAPFLRSTIGAVLAVALAARPVPADFQDLLQIETHLGGHALGLGALLPHVSGRLFQDLEQPEDIRYDQGFGFVLFFQFPPEQPEVPLQVRHLLPGRFHERLHPPNLLLRG